MPAPVAVIDDPSPVELLLTDLTGPADLAGLTGPADLNGPTGLTDLSGPAGPGDAERERRAAAVAADLPAEPFDLATGPLVRAALIRLAAGDHVLVLVLHHIIADGWSAGILARELWALYGQLRRGPRRSCPARRSSSVTMPPGRLAGRRRHWSLA